MNLSRPLKVVLYAAFVGLLLASYISPLQSIVEGRERVSSLQAEVDSLERDNAAKERLTQELETPEGIERVARERYGMLKPGEKAYIVSGEEKE